MTKNDIEKIKQILYNWSWENESRLFLTNSNVDLNPYNLLTIVKDCIGKNGTKVRIFTKDGAILIERIDK